jgi:serine/threonine-protein kinase PpkA
VIEVPGYRILRPLGRGGMATVYLALQESVQREVALKVMSPTLLGDEQFGERFLREARIAAKLKHPHVVQVHDVGRVGDAHYIAMEHLPGGPVLTRNGAPRDLPFALRVTREIASALGYAQSKGVIHRDIKPDNILLREDGTAVLTDFGIARASDNARMTHTGAIIGTPHYMSPEQARGLPLDGRADLYSLGIVFHELLLGRVPYQAEDSLAVGIMHITAPLPKLPAHLSMLQPVLDKLLAKEPAQRFQDGAQLAQTLAGLEREFHGVTRPMAIPARSSAATQLSSRPAMPAPSPADEHEPQRTEPTLGRIDDLLRAPESRRRARVQRTGRGTLWLGLVLLALGLVAGGAWHYQDELRGLLPATRMNELLAQADQALIENRLTRPDGQGARELYGAALALDPDSQAARQGLQRVGARLLDAARAALASNDLSAARAALAKARELSVPAGDADAVQQAIDARATQDVELGSLIERGQAAREAGRLDQGDDSAVALYRRALAAAPGNALATAGLRDTLTAMLERARALAVAGEYDAAGVQIEAVAAIDPAHLGLPEARGHLAQARGQQQAALDAQLAVADDLFERGKWMAPASGNAHQVYRAVLDADPANARARQGLRRLSEGLVAQAQRQMADFEFERARGLLDQAERVDADSPGLGAARARLREVERKHSESIPDPNAAATQQRVAQLLGEAGRAAEAGNLLAPPGDSAYDKYRAVRALDPDNAQAQAGLAALPALARRRFDEALGANRLATAHGAVEALATLAPTDAALPDMRRRLARSLLGQATERLGAGEIKRAQQIFDQARELDPTNPDLPALQARLEQASGG